VVRGRGGFHGGSARASWRKRFGRTDRPTRPWTCSMRIRRMQTEGSTDIRTPVLGFRSARLTRGLPESASTAEPAPGAESRSPTKGTTARPRGTGTWLMDGTGAEALGCRARRESPGLPGTGRRQGRTATHRRAVGRWRRTGCRGRWVVGACGGSPCAARICSVRARCVAGRWRITGPGVRARERRDVMGRVVDGIPVVSRETFLPCGTWRVILPGPHPIQRIPDGGGCPAS
jgi:hypothetical protein